LNPGTPFITVVTDLFDAHATWFSAPADLCIVPTEGARQRGLRWGFPPERMCIVGLPVSLKFALANQPLVIGSPGAWNELRVRLGLEPDRFTILLVGGGEGMGKLEEITRALANSGLPIQLAVIAGRNQALRDKLEKEKWAVPVRVTGFVTNMPEWMRASDLVVTKAGPGTIMETLTAGRPLLLSGYLPGQEEGNVQFVVETGVGAFRDTPEKIVAQVREWLGPGNETLEQMRKCARAQARPDAALEIARLVDLELVSSTTSTPCAKSK
jgi:1,2-diacylglycerol 3-beta-galactosyltransferase